MLSGETAVGEFPFESVAYMDRIARAVEPSLGYRHEIPEAEEKPTVGQAMSNAACDIAEEGGVGLIHARLNRRPFGGGHLQRRMTFALEPARADDMDVDALALELPLDARTLGEDADAADLPRRRGRQAGGVARNPVRGRGAQTGDGTDDGLRLASGAHRGR